MKKSRLLAAILTAGFITCATVSCGETDPKPDDNKQDNGGGSNQPGGNEGGNNQPGGNGGNGGGHSEAQTITATVKEALAITVPEGEKSPDYYEITGTLKNVAKQDNNPKTYNFELEDSTGTIISWGTGDPIPSGFATANGKTAKVKGKIKNFKGVLQFHYPKVTLLGGSSDGGDTGGDTDNGGNDQGGGSTTTAPSFDDLTGAITVKEAHDLVIDLPAGEDVGKKYIYGTVTNDKEIGKYGNCWLLDEDNSTKIFLFGDEKNYKKNKYVIGDKILVYGKVMHFVETEKDKDFPEVFKPDIIEVQKAA